MVLVAVSLWAEVRTLCGIADGDSRIEGIASHDAIITSVGRLIVFAGNHADHKQTACGELIKNSHNPVILLLFIVFIL